MVNMINLMAYGLLTSVSMAASIGSKKHDHLHKHRQAKVQCTETTAPYPIANGTTPIAISEPASTASDVGATSQPVVTVSVIPVPIPSSSASVAASSVGSSPAAGSSLGGSGPASSACGVVTTYVTVQQTIFVTATQPPSTTLASVASSSSSVSVAAPSSSSAVSVPAPPPSSTVVASVPAPSAPVATAPSPSAPVATAPSTSSAAQLLQSSASVSSSAAPATSSSVTPVGSGPYTGPKIGISWDPNTNYDLSSVGLTIPPSWAYDWGQVAHGVPSGIQYVPSVHDASKCAGMAADLAGSGATYVKHFNEPDQTGSGGSGLSVASAASLHNQYIAPLMNQYLIGLPAVTSNNIPGTSGTGWLTSFVEQVGCDGFKFADFHFYGGGGDASSQANIFMGYVQNWISTVDTICPGKELPIWISEFSATPVGDTSLATAFMQIVGPQLDANPRVARYAYWFPSNNQIDSVVASVLGSVGL